VQLLAPPVTHPDRAPPVEEDPRRERVGADREVGPLHRRAQIRIGGAAALTPADRHLEIAEALLLETVHVVGQGVTGLPAGLEPGGVQGVLQQAAARRERSVRAAIVVAATGAALGALEVRQHVAVAPARCPLALPALVVERVAAHVHHAVDRRGAAEDLAARGVQAAAVQLWLALGVVAPVVLRHVHRDRQRARHLDPHRAIGAAVLEQQHLVAAVLGQAVREHAAGGAGADDEVVDGFLRHDLSPQ